MFKALFTVSAWTGISRISGAARDILMAAVLGTGPVAEAFIIAFRLPNMFRRIFAEGAFNSTFVPLLSQELEQDKQRHEKENDHKGKPASGEKSNRGAELFANNAMSWLVTVLIIFSALSLVFMPQLISLLASGFQQNTFKHDLTVFMARICFFYLTFMALTSLISGVLNSFNYFFAAAAAPVFLNFSLVTCLIAISFFIPDLQQDLHDQAQPQNLPFGVYAYYSSGSMLAWTTVIAGFGQVFIVWIAARKTGIRLSFMLPALSVKICQLFKLMIPGIISAGVQQINLLIGTRLVSSIAGAVAFMSYADRLYQLPLGLIGVGLSIVLLPGLSRLLESGNQKEALERFNRSLEFSLFLALPAGTALFILAEPLVILLYEYGLFTRNDSMATALALQAYAFGLPFFVLNKVLLTGYFSRKDTKTPMYFALISMFVFALSAMLSIESFGFVGVAAATSLSSLVNVLLLGLGLYHKKFWQGDSRLFKNSLFSFLCSLCMGTILWFSLSFLTHWFDQGTLSRMTASAILVISGLAVYLGSTWLVGNPIYRELRFMKPLR